MTQRLIQTRIRQDVQSMHAYAIQDSRGLVKLDAMENPHTLSVSLQAELGARLGALAINRYPGSRIDDLRTALAHHAGLPAGCGLMLGNGSDELISLLAMAVDQPPAPGEAAPCILAPLPGFVMYAMSAQFQGLGFVGVPLSADFELDEPAMLAAITEHRPAVLYLAYPNNPTANLWDAGAMRRIIAAQGAQGGIAVVDEAYQPFASHSMAGLLGDLQANGHVLIMRTLSKFGLAGVRIGYMMGEAQLVQAIDKLRPPYNISVLNAECALFALEHQDVFKAQADSIKTEREALVAALQTMPGVRVWPSQANMVLCRVADSAKTFAGMKAQGVLVKNVAGLHPLLAQCLRLTVGTPAENIRMLAALRAAL
jgi:histidinol-phosphate aminotransferase